MVSSTTSNVMSTKLVLALCVVASLLPALATVFAFMANAEPVELDGTERMGYYAGEDTAGAYLSAALHYLYCTAPFRNVVRVITVVVLCGLVRESKSKPLAGLRRAVGPLDAQHGALLLC
mmetsp:Transcript_48023/g.104442  ORF Transcript_48023/g.104442 Transcript_48023/m.104442 type:complete len:120 (-) Transcript_48023:538-897(-)